MRKYLPAVLALLFACSCSSDSKSNFETDATLTDNDSAYLQAPQSKIVKRATIQLKVSDVEKTTEKLSGMVTEIGGLVTELKIGSSNTITKEVKTSADSVMLLSTLAPMADFVAKIPDAKLETFSRDAAKLGYLVESVSFNADDKTLAFFQNNLFRENRKLMLEDHQIDSIGVAGKLSLRDDMTKELLSNKQVDLDVIFSTISIHLYSNPRLLSEQIVNTDLDRFSVPVRTRFVDNVVEGWLAVLNVFIFLARFWFIPVLLMVLATSRKVALRKFPALFR